MPLNGNYYCLLDDGVMEAQAELAKKYGVYGFCYYHYWFAHGKKLLEKPIERMLKNPNVDIPFCLCWANENWTRLWDGGRNEVIVAQDYDDMDNLNRHIDYLCEFFSDHRYIKQDGKPFFVIYRPNIIPNIKERLHYIRERVKNNGLPGLFIAAQYPEYLQMDGTCADLGVDAYIQNQPSFATFNPLINILRTVKLLAPVYYLARKLRRQCRIIDYDDIWEKILAFRNNDPRFIAGAFKDWDNSPRRRRTGSLYRGVTPEKFGAYMRRLVQKVRNEYNFQYIFLNSWNEWCESSYIEPDERYGYAYLEALHDALSLQ